MQLHRSRLLVASMLAAALMMILATAVFAHAEFASSVPAPGSVVSSVPKVVKVTFTEGVNPKGSALTVVGPNGARADQGDGHVDLTDPDRKTMLVSLKPGLGAGKYTVSWTTVSADDGDTASGTFTFTVQLSAQPTAAVATLPRTGGPPIGEMVGPAVLLLGAGVFLRWRQR